MARERGGPPAASECVHPAQERAAMSVMAAPGAAAGARGNVSLALTLGLALFLLVNAFAINKLLPLVSPEYYSETVLNHSADVLHAEGCDDSWGIMAYALQYAQSPHTTPLYTEIRSEEHT